MINSLTLSTSNVAPEESVVPAKGAEMLEKSGVNFGELLTVEEGVDIKTDATVHTETDAVALPWFEVTPPQAHTKTSATPGKTVEIKFNLTTEGIPETPPETPIARAKTDAPATSIKPQAIAATDMQSLEAVTASTRKADSTPRAELVTPLQNEISQPANRMDAPEVSPSQANSRAKSASTTSHPAAPTPPPVAREQVAAQANTTASAQATAEAYPPAAPEPAARNLNRLSNTDAQAPIRRSTNNLATTSTAFQANAPESIAPITGEPIVQDMANSVNALEAPSEQSTATRSPIDIDTAQAADAKAPVMRDTPTPEPKIAMIETAHAPKADIATPVSSAPANFASADIVETTTTISQSVSAAAPSSTGPALNAAAPTQLQAPVPLPAMPPQAVAGVVIERMINEPDNSDRIVVQLDPPELGRVAIDFKFDAQGLQTVTITGESPEALKQLRLMHFELVQALEEHGISGSDLTFAENSSQQSQQNPSSFAETNSQDTAPEPDFSEPQATRPTHYTKTDSGLDLKL